VGVEGCGEGRETDRRWNDCENLESMSSDKERCEGGACAERSPEEHEARGARGEWCGEGEKDSEALLEYSG